MRFLVVVFLCCLGPAALSQSSDPSLTVADAISSAVKKNPRLSAVVRDIRAANAGKASAQALADPSITFAPGITSLSGTGEELMISQPLEINGTRAARTGVAEAKVSQAKALSLVELNNLVFAVKSAYYELARSRENVVLARELLSSAQEFDRIVRRQVELGSRPGIDQTQTEIEVLRAQQQITLAEGDAASAQAVLNTLMGRDSASPIPSLSALNAGVAKVDRDSAMQAALRDRAEIAAEKAGGDVFRQEARLTRAQGIPDIAPQFRAGSVVRAFKDYGMGIGINLPLLDYGNRKNRIRQAQESAQAQDSRAEAVRQQARQEVDQALARLQAAENSLKQYDEGLLDRSRRLVEASRKGLEAGQVNITAVLEAQRTYRTVQTERLSALVRYIHARTELERATGAVQPSLLNNVELKGKVGK